MECESISLKTVTWGMFTQMRFVVLAENLDMSIQRTTATEKKRFCPG